jgi:hypothetical protein
MAVVKWWNGSAWVRRLVKQKPTSTWINRTVKYPPAAYDGSTVAWYDFNYGVTKDGSNLVSVWKDRSGNAHDLEQATGTNQPLWSADGITFDGIDNFMKTAAFTFNPTECIYIVFKQISWTSGDAIFDGNTSEVILFFQNDVTPKLRIYTGDFSTPNDNLSVDVLGIARIMLTGSEIKLQINETVKFIDGGISYSMGGITLGSSGAGNSRFGNILIKEAIFRNVADTAADEQKIYNYLITKYGL